MTNATPILDIVNLSAEVEGTPILKGISLSVRPGEVHAIMGPNGSGKSTLSKVIAGDPAYHVTGGEVIFTPEDKPIALLDLEADERAREGIFLGFQYPIEVPGVPNSVFLRTALNLICKQQGAPEVSQAAFDKLLSEKMKLLSMKSDFAERDLNVDFSGGEKKRNEILQMAVLSPRVAFLDETDSGLDVDSLRIIGDGIKKLRHPGMAVVLVTHYQRLLDHVAPDYVHILINGRIVKSGGPELALEVEKNGYEAVRAEAGA